MEYLTKEDVAKELKVNPRTVQRWLKSGTLAGHKLGKSKTSLWRISKTDFNKFLTKTRNQK